MKVNIRRGQGPERPTERAIPRKAAAPEPAALPNVRFVEDGARAAPRRYVSVADAERAAFRRFISGE